MNKRTIVFYNEKTKDWYFGFWRQDCDITETGLTRQYIMTEYPKHGWEVISWSEFPIRKPLT